MDQRTRNSLSLLNFWQMGFMWVLALLWSYILLCSRKFIGSERTFPSCPPDIHHNLACIVTGASSGIGRATAEALALRGYCVIFAGRSIVQLLKVVEEFKMRHKRVLVRAMEVDLTSIGSILKFKDNVEELLKAQDAPTSLQLLINNAGILATTQRTTSEGCDYMIASNYLGHFMLTQLLLPLMCKGTESVRIVNVGSFTHRCVRTVHMPEEFITQQEVQMLMMPRKNIPVYRFPHIYETSKLFMVLFTYELHHRLNSGSSSNQITAMAADPGVVHTGIFREFPGWLSACVISCLWITGIMQSPSVGCKAVVDAALAPPSESGKYFYGGCGRTVVSSALSYDQGLAEGLWESSAQLYEAALAQHRRML